VQPWPTAPEPKKTRRYRVHPTTINTNDSTTDNTIAAPLTNAADAA
jgi:hypothetical protein